MKLWITTTLIVMMAVVACPATAVERTPSGNELLESCERENAAFNEDICKGGIAGLFTVALVIARAEVSTDRVPFFCYPKGATINQVERVVIKYLKEHPEKLHESSLDLLQSALAEAWPCE